MFGSFACGFASQYFGHRNALILINIPQFIAFISFYYASTMTQVIVANLLLGFGCGFMKAPCTTFVTEIRYFLRVVINKTCKILCTCLMNWIILSETKIRGVLVSMTSIAITSAPLIVFSLSLATSWRNIALYWCIIQSFTMVALFCVSKFEI